MNVHRGYAIGYRIGVALRLAGAAVLIGWIATEAPGWVAYWSLNPPQGF